jgi:hypothetical protein
VNWFFSCSAFSLCTSFLQVICSTNMLVLVLVLVLFLVLVLVFFPVLILHINTPKYRTGHKAPPLS